MIYTLWDGSSVGVLFSQVCVIGSGFGAVLGWFTVGFGLVWVDSTDPSVGPGRLADFPKPACPELPVYEFP